VGRQSAPDAAAAVFAAVVVIAAGYLHDTHDPGAIATALSGLAGLSLAGRRRRPVGTVILSAAFAFPVLAVDRQLASHAMLIPAVALLSVALLGSGARRILAGVGLLAVAVAAVVLNPHRIGLMYPAQHLTWIAVPILLIEGARTRRDYLTGLGERLTLLKLIREQEAQRRVQDERLRIARELHDVVAHTLTTINVQASVAGHLLDERPTQARHALGVIEEASRDGIGELRAILGVLRDTDVDVSRAPAPGLDEMPNLIELARDSGLHTDYDVTGTRPDRIPETVSLAAYRIVQESLTNVARHAVGSVVRVHLRFRADELAIAVENSSPGTPPRPGPDSAATLAGATARVGIVGMTERAEALGGTLTAAASETGFCVAARLPYRTA
jgi:signal transduction histidine kinase